MKQAIRRTVLYEAGNTDCAFRLESWWMPFDEKEESVTRLALVWDAGDEDNEKVVLLGDSAVEDVMDALVAYLCERAPVPRGEGGPP